MQERSRTLSIYLEDQIDQTSESESPRRALVSFRWASSCRLRHNLLSCGQLNWVDVAPVGGLELSPTYHNSGSVYCSPVPRLPIGTRIRILSITLDQTTLCGISIRRS